MSKPKILLFSSFVLSLLCPPVLGQSDKPSKGRAQVEQKSDYYDKWLEEDVAYIIAPEERAVFLKLNTDEERDQFIEQFWRRRDTDPRTPENEFKEEHYRRIQYANERFHAGIPGWKTDRGRVYIAFGKPDRIESYPAGGSYQRKPHEGGGWTSVYPFEVWEYRFIEGVGDDIELEFVNDAGGNLYRLTMDPQDKDELLRVPGMGLTDAELFYPQFGGRKSYARVNRIREGGDAYNQGNYLERAKDHPFQKAALLMRISKAPPIRFTDLKEKIAANITYNLLPFKASSHHLRIGDGDFLVPVTLSFEHNDISFKEEDGGLQSRLQVYGVVTTLARQAVFEFDDEIISEQPKEQGDAGEAVLYQRKLALIPGKYKLDLMVKDAVSGRLGSLALGLEIPSAPQGRLAMSSVLLTRSIRPAGEGRNSAFVLGPYKIRPQVDRTFTPEDSLGFYLEAYNFTTDASTQMPVLRIEYGIAAPGMEPATRRPITRGVTVAGNRVTIARMVELRSVPKGKHELVLSISDTLSGQTSTARAPFEVR